jgi:hypothetical protein
MIYNLVIGLICSIFTLFPLYKLFQLKSNFKNCWSSIKCTQMGQMLFPLFGPKHVTSTQNKHICDSNKFSAMFNSKIKSVNNNVNVLNNAVSSINDDITGVKTNIYNIQVKAIQDLKNIAISFKKMYQRISNLGITIFQTLSQIMNIFKYMLTTIQMAYYSTKSLWDGPIRKTARFFGGI